MYMPKNPLGYSCIKKLQKDNLLHAYNEPINIYSVHNMGKYKYSYDPTWTSFDLIITTRVSTQEVKLAKPQD